MLLWWLLAFDVFMRSIIFIYRDFQVALFWFLLCCLVFISFPLLFSSSVLQRWWAWRWGFCRDSPGAGNGAFNAEWARHWSLILFLLFFRGSDNVLFEVPLFLGSVQGLRAVKISQGHGDRRGKAQEGRGRGWNLQPVTAIMVVSPTSNSETAFIFWFPWPPLIFRFFGFSHLSTKMIGKNNIYVHCNKTSSRLFLFLFFRVLED